MHRLFEDGLFDLAHLGHNANAIERLACAVMEIECLNAQHISTPQINFDDTLVIWTGEFGRTPDNNKRGGVYSLGRGHNADAMTMLMAGGGVKKGSIVGATDEIGAKAVEVAHPIRDLHVTLLHLLGLDDNKLTYFHAGRYKQLSQFGGKVIKELIA